MAADGLPDPGRAIHSNKNIVFRYRNSVDILIDVLAKTADTWIYFDDFPPPLLPNEFNVRGETSQPQGVKGLPGY